jgi:hypothetical protein
LSTYSFARIAAAFKMKLEDVRPRDAGCTIRLQMRFRYSKFHPAEGRGRLASA